MLSHELTKEEIINREAMSLKLSTDFRVFLIKHEEYIFPSKCKFTIPIADWRKLYGIAITNLFASVTNYNLGLTNDKSLQH